MNVEILASKHIKNAFKDLEIDATRTYKGSNEPYYEVWEIDKKDLHLLDEAVWLNEYGWWCYSKGSNMGTAFDVFTVNGKELIAWGGPVRDNLMDDWNEMSGAEKEKYNYSYKKFEQEKMPYEYDSLLEYFKEELGADEYDEICGLAVHLARENRMTVTRLFTDFEG